MEIKAFKRRFDRVLARELRRRVTEIKRLTSDSKIREIAGYAERLVMAGGKRVRPYLAYIAYKVAGGKKDQDILEMIAGLELFHAFALVHDDIMDRGTTRHGLPTVHAVFGDSQAILLGDLLFNWANSCLSGTTAYPIFQKMIDEVITGQMLDVDSMTRKTVGEGMIEERHRLKTASYTFVRPMQIGIALSQVESRRSQKFMKFAEAYGMPLGVGFQIQDDWLDLTSKPDAIGKTAFSDLRDGQHTLFTQYIVERGTAAQKKELKKVFGNKKLTEKDRQRIERLFEESGAIEHGCMLMEAYFEEAEEAVVAAPLPTEHKKVFSGLIEYISARRS